MSDLIIAVFRNQTVAFTAGETLAALQQSAGTEPEDIVVVTRDKSGRVTINQSVSLATGRPLAGGRWGALIGMLFLDPLTSHPKGKGIGTRFRAAGLDDRFLQDVGRSLANQGAAVGLRVRLLGKDRVIDALKGFKGSPKVLWTRLGPDTEEALTDMQDQIPEQALSQAQANGEL
ncbi:MAG: hypothetical protein FD152_122 [Xanthobacteraceae bacterium]|nr:MAG: hypothetical protein FD152_122 [Xanthobacteraceae bacterium]